MSGLNGILNIGAGALRTHQTAINVTGHNIANVNTPGYSRQRVNVSANNPLTMKFGQAGTGVNAFGVVRSYDRFLNGQINNEIENMGRWQAQESPLAQVETIFSAGSSYGLDETLNEFWNAWQDLSNNPSGMTERTVLLAKGEGLANAFQEVNTNLTKVQEDLTDSVNGGVSEINSIASQIADINKLIGNVEVHGQRANDYRDQRDVLIDELSSKIDVTTTEGDNGMMTINVGNNEVLVEDVRSFELSFDDPDFTIQTTSGTAVIDGDDISGGAIRGWLDVRDTDIPGYEGQLNDLAAGIIDSVNTLHVTGTGLDGTQNDYFTGSSASDIAVNSAIVADVNKIAAAGPGGSIPGDNSMAVAIAGLQHQQTMNGNMATFNEFYQSLISDVGSTVRQSATNFTHHKDMANYLDSRREAVSGVNLDEEMVNLVKFQNAYEAAAKIISTVDEMLATVINMV